MARTKAANAKWSAPNDDLARGNVGTGDQGPGDVFPGDHVTSHTGELPMRDPQPTLADKAKRRR
jgi:hypothetical protein